MKQTNNNKQLNSKYLENGVQMSGSLGSVLKEVLLLEELKQCANHG